MWLPARGQGPKMAIDLLPTENLPQNLYSNVFNMYSILVRCCRICQIPNWDVQCGFGRMMRHAVDICRCEVHWCGGSNPEEMSFFASPFPDCQADLSDAELLEWKHWSTDDLSENAALHGACSFLIHFQWQCPELVFWSEACSWCIRCCVMLCFMFLRWAFWFQQFAHRHLIAREFWGRSSDGLLKILENAPWHDLPSQFLFSSCFDSFGKRLGCRR